MILEEFKDLLQTYGTDLGRWPSGQSAEAERLRDALPEAQLAWEDAQRLDILFRMDCDRDREVSVDISRQNAIISAALQRVRTSGESLFDWRKLCTRYVSSLLAATAAAGAIAAFVISPGPMHRPREVPLVNLLLAADILRLQDLL